MQDASRFDGTVPTPPDLPPTPLLVPWPELHPTTQSAYNEILWKRGLAKADLARMLGVSRTRMTAVGRELEDAGLVTTGGKGAVATFGRPGELLVAVPDRYHFLGVHVRAHQLVAAVIDMTNRVVWEGRADIANVGANVVVDHCLRWLDEARRAGLRVAALSVCGSFQQLAEGPAGLDLRGVIGREDRLRLAERIGGPVHIEDDMVALTAFEHWPRLGEGQDSMALVALGSEIGFGLVVDRHIVVGAHRTAGRFAHIPVGLDGAPCPLGHHGCLWGVASGSAIVARCPGAHSLSDVIERAAADESAARLLDSAAIGLGRAIAYIANLIDPDKVVLAGEARELLHGREDAFLRAVRGELLGIEPQIETTDFGFIEWARAAAALGLYRTLGGDRI